MALIKCPECKKKISDQCENCPNCGYPINKICETNENQTTNIEDINETPAKDKKSFNIKSLLKKWWFWVAVVVVITAITTTTILLLNSDTKPKFDKEGNPVFVELTNEVYTNAKKHKGYHINIKGQVFQVMSDNGSVKGIQIWIDPDTCEQNMMIYYNTDVEVKQGDYIMCSGYIDSVTEYKNAYNAVLYAPLIISSDLVKATYIDVMSPTTATITPENLKQEKYGYSISIDKIEFAKKETRVYATVKNNGKALLNIGDAVIVQNGKQYNSTDNYEANYEEIPYEIVKGVSSSGIIVFPAISTNDFELTIDIHSNDYDEEIDKFVFKISKDGVVAEKPATLPITSTTTQTSKNRNNEAIREAENLSQFFFPTDRSFIKSVLVNPSAQQDFDGFTDSEADYAIENANIDWKKHALEGISGISEDGSTIPNNIAHELGAKNFTDNEIQYVLDNCGIDWNKASANRISTFVGKVYITKNQVIERILLDGFTKSQVEYGIKNSNINWSSQIYYFVSNLHDKYIDFTWCDNCGNIFGVYDNCPICGGSVSIQGAFGYTKNEIKSKLRSEGFTDSEIEKGLQAFVDSYFYDESKYKKP